MRKPTCGAVLLLAFLFGASTVACTAQPAAATSSSSTAKKKKSADADDEDEEDEDGDDEQPRRPRSTPPDDAEPTPEEPMPDAPTTPTPGGGQCAQQQQNPDACIDCCMGGNPEATAQADQAFGQCACTSACAQACGGSFCRGAQPTAACEQCLNQAQQCEQAWQQACQADAGCRAVEQCIQSSCQL